MFNENENNELEQCHQLAKQYADILNQPEQQDLLQRLQLIENKLLEITKLEEIVTISGEIDEIFKIQENLAKLNIQLTELSQDLDIANRYKWTFFERQIFANRTQDEIEEIQTLMMLWSSGTYDKVIESVLDHAERKGYDLLDYLRSAANFNKNKAVRIPPLGFRDDDTVRWENKRTGEFLIEDNLGKIRTYGVN